MSQRLITVFGLSSLQWKYQSIFAPWQQTERIAHLLHFQLPCLDQPKTIRNRNTNENTNRNTNTNTNANTNNTIKDEDIALWKDLDKDKKEIR